MPIVLYGMNHTSAPLEVRERLAWPAAEVGAAVARLVGTDSVDEGLILSTCNRTELLVRMRSVGDGAVLREFLQQERGVSGEELERHCYLHANQEAVRHVFRVASSLDSMIVGESQILGQVKEAYATAVEAGGLKRVLDTLMQRAFAVAKKVRTETGIARSPTSIAHAAARLARDIFGDLTNNSILIIGAGKMGRLAAQRLISDGAGSVVVVNRSFQRAVDLARELGGKASPFDRLPRELEASDVVVASTAAPHYVIRYDDAVALKRARRGRPLFLIDIAVPRDIDPRINSIDDFYLYDIDELKGVVEANLAERRQEAQYAEAIVERDTAAYLNWLKGQQVAPMIVALREQLHGLGAEELHRFRGRLGVLDEKQRHVVEEFTTALVNKILHRPIQAMKRAAAQPEPVDRVKLLREVFGLDRSPRRTEERTQAPVEGSTSASPAEDRSTGGRDESESPRRSEA